MKDGGDDHCHVPAFVEVHCLEQAVVGHSIGVGAFQKQLDVFHLQEIKTRFKRNVKTLLFFSKTISLKKKFHDNVSVDTFFICQINNIILKKNVITMKLARFCQQMAAIVKLNMILLPTSSLSSLFTIKYMYSVTITFTIRQPLQILTCIRATNIPVKLIEFFFLELNTT